MKKLIFILAIATVVVTLSVKGYSDDAILNAYRSLEKSERDRVLNTLSESGHLVWLAPVEPKGPYVPTWQSIGPMGFVITDATTDLESVLKDLKDQNRLSEDNFNNNTVGISCVNPGSYGMPANLRSCVLSVFDQDPKGCKGTGIEKEYPFLITLDFKLFRQLSYHVDYVFYSVGGDCSTIRVKP